MQSAGAGSLGLSGERATRWPFSVGMALLLAGALGFLYAPVPGIVYLAFPGIAIANFWAFATGSPARVALAVASGLFVLGAVGFITGTLSLASDELFFVQEIGFGAGLILLPIPGVVIGFGALVVALFRPGQRPGVEGEIEPEYGGVV